MNKTLYILKYSKVDLHSLSRELISCQSELPFDVHQTHIANETQASSDHRCKNLRLQILT